MGADFRSVGYQMLFESKVCPYLGLTGAKFEARVLTSMMNPNQGLSGPAM